MTKFGSAFKALIWLIALPLTAQLPGCGGGGGNDSTSAGAACVGAACVSLGTAASYVILAKTGISSVPASVITGNLGLSPAAASFITGFSLVADSSNTFSKSTQVTGKIYAADYAPPTPTNLTTAVLNMQAAYTDAAGRAPGAGNTNIGAAGEIGGLVIFPGVYNWTGGVTIATDVTISGTSTDVWIFQIPGNLTQSNGIRVTLAGGALAKNIFWQVAGIVSVGTTAHFEGIALSQTAITMGTNSSANGRLLAQTAVTLDQTTVTQP